MTFDFPYAPKWALRRYRSSTGGNVGVMTVIFLGMLLMVVAAGIDITRGANHKSELANASDGIALMLAKSQIKGQAEMNRAASAYLAKHYPAEEAKNLKIERIDRDGDKVTVELSNVSETMFGGITGRDSTPVSVSATAVWSEKTVDIALVLDTTHSMSGTRIASLKKAATDMVTTLDKSESDKISMSVVPFADYVNVGKSNRNASWIDVPADTSETKEHCWNHSEVISKSNCRKVARTCTRDGVSYSCDYTKCDEVRGPKERRCKMRTTHKKWNGCVGSRIEPFDTRVDVVAGNRVPGLLNASCGAQLQPLSSDLSKAKTTIAKLNPKNETYMPSGLLWGWRTLDERDPFASSPDPKVEKVMVLMTDGENTKSKNGRWHNKGNKKDADDKTKALCGLIKAEDIHIYTIAYEVTDSATKTLLSNCATDSGSYFDAKNAAQLSSAFEEIANSLNALRISA